MIGDPLPPLAPGWAEYEERFHDIARVVQYSPGFVLVPVAVPGPDLARGLGYWLSEAGYPVTVVDLIGDAEWERLAGTLMTMKLPPSGVALVVGRAAPPAGVHGALGLVNQARDAITKQLRRPLLWCGPRAFLNLTWERAPDFWSIGSVVHDLEAVAVHDLQAAAVERAPAAAPAESGAPAAESGAPAAESGAPVELEAAGAESGPVALAAAGTESGPGAPSPPAQPVAKSAAPPPAPEPAQEAPYLAVILAAGAAEKALENGDAQAVLSIADPHLSRQAKSAGEVGASQAKDAARAQRPGPEAEALQRLAVARARALGMLGRSEEAAAELSDLLSTRGLPPAVKLDAVLEMGQSKLRSGDTASAESYLARAQSIAKDIGSADREVLARIRLGEVATQRGQTQTALSALSQAASDAQELHDDELIKTSRAALHEVLEKGYDSSAARRIRGLERLPADDILALCSAALSLELSRKALLAGIARTVVATLPEHAYPAAQIRSDLDELNGIERGPDGGRPLETWLQNAVALCGPRQEAVVFRMALTKLGAGEAGAGAPSPGAVWLSSSAAPMSPRTGAVSPGSAPVSPGAPAAAPAPMARAAPSKEAAAVAPPAMKPATAAKAEPGPKKAAAEERAKRKADVPAERVPLTVVLYASRDEIWAEHLRKHATPLLREGLTRWWSPADIPAGAPVEREMKRHVAAADVVVVLVSPELLASPHPMVAVGLAPRPGKHIVPVLVRSADLSGVPFLENLVVLPRNGRPLVAAQRRDRALEDVVVELRALLERIRSGGPPAAAR